MTISKLISGMRAERYHKKKCLSSTIARNLLASLQLAGYRMWIPIESKALHMGEAIHTAILEPIRFKKKYAKAPDARKGSKEWVGFQAANPSKTILNRSDYDTCVGMDISVQNHKTAGGMLRRASDEQREVSVFCTDPGSGVEMKCRCDILLDDAIIDIKSTRDADPDNFSKSIANYGYHIQAAFYQFVVKEHLGVSLPFYFVAVEKTAPHLVGVYELDEESIEEGRRLMQQAILLYKENQDENELLLINNRDGYGLGVKTLRLPPWKLKTEASIDE